MKIYPSTSEESKIEKSLEKFLFLFEINTLAPHCLILSLRSTQQILSIFGFFGSFYGIYLGIIADNTFDKIHHISMDICSFIICSLIFASTFTYDPVQAYFGYAISVWRSFIYFIIHFGRIIFECKGKDSNCMINGNLNCFKNIMIVMFFTWVNYSYTRKLVKGELPEMINKRK